MAKKEISRLTKAILETADGVHRTRIFDDETHEKITLRHLGKPTGAADPITGEEIRQVREQAHLSQAVFARCLNVTTGYVSQLERGAKRPTGAALALLNVIRRKGIEVVL
jgi:putative transcriptional regulator